ncbi:ammonium transporter [Cellvibrio fibrivorans]|uniref:Ammonium transporter n=2 Tax=Cellvibrio fibrivorans TaxID=126350 RepID=A0ABU1UTP4_9GAMM|nr:ammonium transporter [Cellvibrio fibrivorans]MDR7088540.1 Amt family ammonium transporter [Cellvibrio fibrivorans]
MNKLLSMGAKLTPLALLAASLLAPGSAFAQEAAEAAAPVAASFDKGDIAWMLTATLLVIFMVLPGLALFYGGMVRAKNILSLSMQVFVTFCLIAVLWSIYGYSLAFTSGSAFFGGFDRLFLKDMLDAAGNLLPAATFSKGVYVPEYLYAAFQMTFAALTPCLIVGAFAERMKFSAVLIFAVLWFTFAYLPIAHMVWFWAGPDAYTTAEAAAAATAGAGYIFQMGALDFAGGTVVHINAGIAGLVGCLLIGKRKGFGNSSLAPHNVPFTMVGAAILWVGWFGFNVGSNLEANAFAAQVFINTFLATAAAVLAWTFGEWLVRGKPTMLGAASGAIAGLVAITPACGWVGPMGALAIGVAGGLICMLAVIKLKAMLGYDDSLDVFGVHCVGGIVGAILTGVFNSPDLGGTGVYDYVAGTWGFTSIGAQTWIQIKAVLVTIVWSAVVSFIAFKLIDVLIGLRVTEEVETEGLDTAEHGERGYHM